MPRVVLYRQDKAMVNVQFSDADDSPTQAYALARWRENPKISPSSWRQALGCTVGKVAFDGRCGLEGLAEAVGAGCNMIVVPALQMATVVEKLNVGDIERDQVVIVAVGVPEAFVDGADWWLWPVGGEAPDAARLVRLEQAVREGALGAYGVSGEAEMDLAAWMAAAEQAAEAVWHRKKRSGLRVVEVPLNGAEQVALRGANGRGKESVLDMAARRGMAVLARRADRWGGPWGEVEVGLEAPAAAPEALAALVAVGEAEQGVEGLRGGVLAALAAGVAPWPSRAAWQVFMKTQWPEMERMLEERGEGAYLTAWRGLLPHGESLSAMAEARLARVVESQMAKALPETWQTASPKAQAWGMVSSVPGVTAVMADLRSRGARNAMVEAMERPDVADVKRALDGVIHRP